MKHLTVEQRYTISVLRNTGSSQKEIAVTIGKHKSIVSWELKRNRKPDGSYDYEQAHNLYQQRKASIPKAVLFTQQMKGEIESCISDLNLPLFSCQIPRACDSPTSSASETPKYYK